MSDRPQPVQNASRLVGAFVLIANGIPPLARAFGYLEWTATQIDAYTVFIGVLAAAASLVMGQRVAGLVTPVSDPFDNEGNPLVPAAPRTPPI